MHVVIFEGNHWPSFAPVALGRPVFMLATGMATLLEKQIRHTNPSRLTLWVREELADFVRRRIAPKLKVPTDVNTPLDDRPALILSGRTLHFRNYQVPDEPAVVLDEGKLVCSAFVKDMAGLTQHDALARTDRWLQITRLPPMASQTRLVNRLWDLIKWNEESLIEDHALAHREKVPRPKGAYHVIDEEQVWIGPDVSVSPGAVFDGSRGPVVIDHHAFIGPNAVLQGPCYIGPYAQVMPLAIIRAGTSIGMMCKVGGEISN
ncbi:MAG: putative sugar nucleotidyl transferase, partial [Tepidisphaeraceae bacterium]